MQKRSYLDYFDNFAASADCALRASVILNELIMNFNTDELAKKMDEIHSLEHEADNIKHVTTDRLAREFLPPIGREDVMSLMQELDDVVDSIDEVMRLLCLFNIEVLNDAVKPFGDLLVRCCRSLKALVIDFKNFKKSSTVNKHIVSINSLETEGDTLHFKTINSLFSCPHISIDIIIWKEIFDGFEECFDGCEHVADVIEGVILKNS